MKLLRKYIIELLIESRTPRGGDLSSEEILELIDFLISGESALEITEKFAGTHLTITVSPNGKIESQYKSMQKSDTFREVSGELKNIFANHPEVSQKVVYKFEKIAPHNRPDYVNYITGNNTFYIEYSGSLTQQLASKLSNSGENSIFISRKDIKKKPPANLNSKQQNALAEFADILSSGKVSKLQKEEMMSYVSQLLRSTYPESLLGGGTEGVMVRGSNRSYKIPDPMYADLQKLQAPIYAVFSGKARIPKNKIKERMVSNENGDRIINDIKKYLEASSKGFEVGFKTFFNPSEASSLLSDLNSSKLERLENLYSKFNERINDRSSWTKT